MHQPINHTIKQKPIIIKTSFFTNKTNPARWRVITGEPGDGQAIPFRQLNSAQVLRYVILLFILRGRREFGRKFKLKYVRHDKNTIMLWKTQL